MCLLKNLVDPSFVNLMQDEIASDDSIIRHHYQRQNVWPGADGSAASVTGWYGLHFANRPCTPLIFYACQSNTVMTTSMTSLPNKTQISLWWLRSLTLFHRSHPLISPIEWERGEWWRSRYWSWCPNCYLSSALARFCLPRCGCWQPKENNTVIKVFLWGSVTCCWLPFVCQLSGLSFFMRSLSLDHRDLRTHRSFAVTIPRAQIVGTALFWNMMEMCWTNLALAGLAEY